MAPRRRSKQPCRSMTRPGARPSSIGTRGGPPSPTVSPPQRVERTVASDPVQPGLHVRYGWKLLAGPVGCEEGLLQEVLGQRSVPPEARNRPIRDSYVTKTSSKFSREDWLLPESTCGWPLMPVWSLSGGSRDAAHRSVSALGSVATAFYLQAADMRIRPYRSFTALLQTDDIDRGVPSACMKTEESRSAQPVASASGARSRSASSGSALPTSSMNRRVATPSARRSSSGWSECTRVSSKGRTISSGSRSMPLA
jgi:hypothetical protein